jgi:hypothetical protein
LDGQVQEQLFDWPSESDPEKEMTMQRVAKYEKNQVAYICGKPEFVTPCENM